MCVDAIRRITNARCERSLKAIPNKSYYEQNLVLIFADSLFVVITFNLKFNSATTFVHKHSKLWQQLYQTYYFAKHS